MNLCTLLDTRQALGVKTATRWTLLPLCPLSCHRWNVTPAQTSITRMGFAQKNFRLLSTFMIFNRRRDQDNILSLRKWQHWSAGFARPFPTWISRWESTVWDLLSLVYKLKDFKAWLTLEPVHSMQLDQYDVKLASNVLLLTRQSIWHLLPEGIKRRVNPIYQVCFLFVNVVFVWPTHSMDQPSLPSGKVQYHCKLFDIQL